MITRDGENALDPVRSAPIGWMERFDRWFDRWYERKYDIRPVGGGGFIFRFGLIRHRGERIILDDGTTIDPGDVVGELHLDNRRAVQLHREGKSGIRFRREVLRSLPVLASDLVARPDCRAVKAVCGASLFWESAARVGFENRELPPFTRWWLTWWARFLLARFHPAGRRRLAEGDRTVLRQIWMSRRVLLERYGRYATNEASHIAASVLLSLNTPEVGRSRWGSPRPPRCHTREA